MELPDYLETDADQLIRLAGHRIGLEDVVHFFNEGYSAEMIAGQFPTLPLPLVYKVIAFYLENRIEVDQYVTHERCKAEQQRAVTVRTGPSLDELRQRLASIHKTEVS